MVGQHSGFTRHINRLSCLVLISGLWSGLAAAAPSQGSTKPFAPATIRVFWDTSYTQEAYAVPALSFLTALIDEVRPSSLELVPFGETAAPVGRIDMRADAGELEHFVGELDYSGETDISALYRAESDRPSRDACFLVSDGRFTPGRLPSQALPCRVYVISASPEADTNALALLATQGGGKYINLAELNFSEARKHLSSKATAPEPMITDEHDAILNAQLSMAAPPAG